MVSLFFATACCLSLNPPSGEVGYNPDSVDENRTLPLYICVCMDAQPGAKSFTAGQIVYSITDVRIYRIEDIVFADR